MIDFDDLDTQRIADKFAHGFAAVGRQAHRNQVRAGYEAFQPIPADKRATFVIAADFDIDRILRFEQLARFFPVIALQSHVDRDDEIVILVARIDNVHWYAGARLEAGSEFVVHALQVLRGAQCHLALRPGRR